MHGLPPGAHSGCGLCPACPVPALSPCLFPEESRLAEAASGFPIEPGKGMEIHWKWRCGASATRRVTCGSTSLKHKVGASALLRTFPEGSHADAPDSDATRAAGRPAGGQVALPGWPCTPHTGHRARSPAWPGTARPREPENCGTPMTGRNAMDLLAITPERIRRALWRSFLRHGVPGELDVAVHAAMNVVAPVLAARDAEITRLHETLGRVEPPTRPRAGSARAQPAARPRASSARADGPVRVAASRAVLARNRSPSGRRKPQPASP